MPPKLTVHNAEVRTATVEIKTLTVSGKQVTLAVFRQLMEVPLIAADGTFKGEPWGTVNYHPDKCADSPGHVHVVWQEGTELRRSAVTPGHASERHPLARDILHSAIRDGLTRTALSHPDFAGLGVNYVFAGKKPGVTYGAFTIDGVRFTVDDLDRDAAWTFDNATAGINRWHESMSHLPDWREMADRLPTKEHHAAWAKLSELPQLFIAV